ncbi:hypothetical protein GXP70_12435 [Paenibacillus lycopersici]|uniref:Uncharacterized protein n=1 Tax=Paenibacillus lycopersici TaxID=2704462 RepID=A0A6C0FU39_9BACL|nr:hypothetical protein [Paenibacillus lycopersici]QHT60668.1 hypothetical protein GXP70_12435 [Paenibacillus lycopersici]
MPAETAEAVAWALQQSIVVDGDAYPVKKDTCQMLVDKVSEYFNANNIEYGSFSFADLMAGGFLD